jgi:hypothetical protein
MKTHEEMKKHYKSTPPPMGVFLIRNTRTDDFVLGASRNLEGTLNRYRFTLKMSAPNDTFLNCPRLQEDYRELGEAAFEFKTLDVLPPKEEPLWDPTEDLRALEQLWVDELKAKGWKPY